MTEVAPDPQPPQTSSEGPPQELSQPEEAPRPRPFKDSWKDWVLRTTIFLVFLLFASGKFKNQPNAPWVVLFNQIGFGDWFRLFTGALEVTGAFLVLFSKTVELGLILLAAVMLGAIAIVILVLHRPADALIPFAFLGAMIAFWLRRRRV